MTSFDLYCLLDPRDNTIFYVGLTSAGLESRLASHLSAMNCGTGPETGAALCSIGVTPEMRSIRSGLSACEASEAERLLIDQIGLKNLDNKSPGGDVTAPGTPGKWTTRKHKRTRWTEEMLSDLGQTPDLAIARKWSITTTTVAKKRREMGIKSPAEKDKEKWTPEVLARLGEDPDAEIAESLGICLSSVGEYRRRRGIPSPQLKQRKQRWKDHEHLLGKVTDRDLAKIVGIHPSSVRGRRLKHGIPAHKP